MKAWKVTVELRPWPEGGFIVEVPALQGCWVVAPTIEEAVNDIQDGVEMSIASRLDHGEELPPGVERLVGDDTVPMRLDLAIVLK